MVAYCPDLKGGPDIFDLRGINREKGAMVVVRPDQYVSNVLPLDAHDELAAFFGQFMLDRHQYCVSPMSLPMKSMDSFGRLGANRSHSCRFGEDLQRRMAD